MRARFAGLVAVVAVLGSHSIALAEGSAEFDIGDVSGTHDAHDQAVSTPTVMYVDILDGTNEKICWRGNGSIAVFRPAPNGTTQVGGNVGNNNCVDAVNGVNGAYRIALNSDQDVGSEWDLRVCGKSVTNGNCFGAGNVNERLGRLWSYRWDFQENGGNYDEDTSNNGSVYAIVPGGEAGHDAVIEMQMRGVSGAWYSLFANSIGPETTGGVRVGRSVATTGHQVTPEFPLYLNPPAVALYNWVTPTVSNTRLSPSCGSGIVLGSSPGTISFRTNVTAQYVVVCDVDGDGAYNFGGTTDFSSFGDTVVGANTVSWNGTTNAGTPAAAGTYNCIVRVNVGEFHYVAQDIESAFPGIRLYRLGTDRTTRTAINMYWDDADIAVDAENMPAPVSALSPNTSPANGLNPGMYGTAATAFHYAGNVATGNARGWGNFDGDGKGDDNFLDQFSAAATAQSNPLRVSVFTNAGDQDGDGLTNARECAINTDPGDADTDNDGVSDGYEATPSAAPDRDGDGTIDALDPDDDGDGIPTADELGPNENGDGNPSDAANSDNTIPADYLDTDSDNDGVCDGSLPVMGSCVAGPDTDPTDPNTCRDTDNDNCDDCAVTGGNGSAGNPNNDGTDSDSDGTCNLTDPDDDDDGVCDSGSAVPNVCTAGPDTNPTNPNVCIDRDGDPCDDCVRGNGATPMNDGPDTDNDGACNAGDPDDDNDGVPDGQDSNPGNPVLCRDVDSDTCNDCALSGANNSGGAPGNDGPDRDSDGACDAGDADNDNDGVCDGSNPVSGMCVAGPDSDPNNPNVCVDGDNDTCDDCANGTYAPGNDGTDTDGDGACDAGDPDDDNDDVDDGDDSDPTDDNQCSDSDNDGCDDCQSGMFDPNNDGVDEDANGLCDEHEPTDPADTDGDGVDDSVDLDDDNDGILDTAEDTDGADTDTDNDGVPNRLDADSDNDFIDDIFEAGLIDFDTDGDGAVDGPFGANGVADAIETTADSGVSTRGEIDTDGDGDADFVDTDSDDDGASDDDEATTDDPRDDDADGDGIPAAYDAADAGPGSGDSDDDGLSDADECPSAWPCIDSDGDGQPDYAQPADVVAPPGDTDGDGVPDDVECMSEPCPDTDGDGMPDVNDPDDDNDGIPTDDERPEDMDQDTDDDGTPDHLDPDDDGDGIPTHDEDGDGDGNGVPDYLEPPRDGTLAGGALCAVATPGSGGSGVAWWFVLGAVGLGLLRRGRAGHPKKVGSAAVVAALLLTAAPEARAQVALDQLKPAPLPSDGFALSRPDTLSQMQWAVSFLIDYANDPLVYELRDPEEEREVVNDHLVLHLAGAIGVTDRITLFATVPTHLVMRGHDPGALAPEADGAGLGDFALGGRFWLLGEVGSTLALSGELIARLPTASLVNSEQAYSGDRVGSYEPALVLELRSGAFDIRVRPGVRLRQQRTVSNLKLGSELVYGIGMRANVAEGLYAHAELFGSAMFADFGKRETVPLELLFGAKYNVSGWMVGSAIGPGLTKGYGSPDVRWVFTVAYAPEQEGQPRRPAMREPSDYQPEDSDSDGIMDPYDSCPRQPEDKDEYEDIDGCPDLDNDRDTVLDVSDHCTMEPEDDDNFEDQNGCPDPDNDQDSVLDVSDQCPLDAEDRDNFQDEDGCPDPDNDQDSVLDSDDECPLAPGAPDARGCPKSVRVDIESGQIIILDRVEFATNRDVIINRSVPIVLEVQSTLSANQQLTKIRVEGHTDDVGRDNKNMELSRRRARSVARWLIEHGVEARRLEAYGCGENRPIAEGRSKDARQQNRRVEFHIVEPSTGEARDTEGCEPIDVE